MFLYPLIQLRSQNIAKHSKTNRCLYAFICFLLVWCSFFYSFCYRFWYNSGQSISFCSIKYSVLSVICGPCPLWLSWHVILQLQASLCLITHPDSLFPMALALSLTTGYHWICSAGLVRPLSVFFFEFQWTNMIIMDKIWAYFISN